MLLYHCYIDTPKYMAWLFPVYRFWYDISIIWITIIWVCLFYCYKNISWIQYMIIFVSLMLRWYSHYLNIPAIDLRCVELSATQNKVPITYVVTTTSRIPHLMNLMPLVILYISCYPITWYKHYYCYWFTE